MTTVATFGADQYAEKELEEFVFADASFEACHASTIVETPGGGLLSAWFGGLEEGDTSVEIWLSSKKPGQKTWSPPEKMTDFPEIPCWNPVLFLDRDNKLWLYFKIGPSPMTWVGAYITSSDGGQSWSGISYLPAGHLGPIRCKPIILSDGTILAGSSVEAGRKRGTPVKPYWSWASWVERSTDNSKTWSIHGPITHPETNFGVIQPTLWQTDSGQVRMLMRSTSQIGWVVESTSNDGGITWEPGKVTSLPNPNSGIDAVKLQDGRVALIYNHTRSGRSPLNLAFSTDDGDTWGTPLILEDEPGEYSYPAIIQSADGKLHMTWTWKRERVKHVVVDPKHH
jgi:predicted neuraminidase